MKKNFAKMLAVTITVSMAVTMSSGTIFADSESGIAADNSDRAGLIEEEINDEDLIAEEPAEPIIPEREEPGGGNEQDEIPEWAVDEEGPSQARLFDKYALPAKFDMREYGWITPVKNQNPWGTCWAFGGIAAAESSIISSGLVPEGYPLDLSEHHLAWFVYKPVTEHDDARQAGEGEYTMSDDINAPFDTGGLPMNVSTFFASGAGPIEEGYFPYWGNNKWTAADTMEQCVVDAIQTAANAAGISFDEEAAVLEERFGVATYEELYAIIEEILLQNLSYSKFDDWSIPAENEEGYSNRNLNEGFVLKNANMIPDYSTGTGEVSEDAIRAMKQEMVDGRAVSISYYADQSGTYVNTAPFDNTGLYGEGVYGGVNYAQYVDTPIELNHVVCVVGWDDNFSASNFCPDHQPPADGAWIVKNSWGSEADAGPDVNGNVVNSEEYGAYNENKQTTGYFYLSYYDMSIAYQHVAANPETFEFSSNIANEGSFYVDQYDYLPASCGFYTLDQDTLMSTANVFTAYENMELISTSTRTASPNTRVTYAIYLLDEDAALPDQGTLLYRRSVNYEYGGFHRLDLDTRLHFDQGQRYSVIATSTLLDGETGSAFYQITASQAMTEEAAVQFNWNTYARKVVNEGESFVYLQDPETGGYTWYDWKETSADLENLSYAQSNESVLIDNFSIKAYSVPAEDQPVDISGAEVTGIIDKTYTGKPVTQEFTVAVEGVMLTENSDYFVIYDNNTNAGTAAVTITGVGDYTGVIRKTFTISPLKITPAVTLGKTSYTYNGKMKTPSVTVKYNKQVLDESDYDVVYADGRKNVGSYKVTVTMKNNYSGTGTAAFKITRADNKITNVKTSYSKTLNYSKKAQKVIALKPTAKENPKFTYKITSMKKGSKTIKTGFTVSKAGVVKTKKKLGKGSYTVQVKISAAKTSNYNATSKAVTLKVKIK